MANKYVDGFEWLPTALGSNISDADMGEGGWYVEKVNGQSFFVTTGRFGYGKCVAVDARQINGFTCRYIKVLPDLSRPSEGYMGWAIWKGSNADPSSWHGVAFYDAITDNCQVSIIFGRNGIIRVVRGFPNEDFDGNGANVIATSKAGSFQEEVWFHLEVYALIADSGGSVEVRINTVPVIQAASVDTKATSNAWYDSFAMIAGDEISGALNCKGRWDDHFINDASGGIHNTWLGNCRVKSQFMIANGATNDFTIGGTSPAATNWQSVLNQNLDDTKYVFSATPGQIDLYAPDPIINAPLVHVVQLRSGLRQDDATQRQAKHLIRISGVNYENAVTQFPNQNYTHYFSRWEVNPLTAVEFTGAEVNGFQVGIKLVA
jgi:hypothetical protein